MRNVSDKVVEKIKTQILCSIICFSSENPTGCEIMWKNMVEPDVTQMGINVAHAHCMLDN
jgi:hypothetical protein